MLYRGDGLGRIAAPRPPLADADLRLRDALRAALEFAESQDLGEWADVFAAALERDEGAREEDLPPAMAYTPESRRLVAMADRAWVSGGMGSWNDLGFDGEVRAGYEEVSEHLYRSVLHALVAAANSELVPAS